jgi:uncharacterized integral membrane protein
VAHEFEKGISYQVDHVVLCSCKEVVQANYIIAIVKQAFAKVRTQKACTTCYQNPFSAHG